MGPRSFAEVHTYLSGLMSETRSRKEAYTLDRMEALMSFLGDPQDSYKVIHVAGTSGKSSTCYYMSSLLGASGKKVGLSVSPHVDEVNERIQINNRPLNEQEFCSEFSRFLQLIEPSGIAPTYFELLVAFAFWEFAEAKVEYAVIEVGLGGLLDGTNVINRSDKICIITDIGYDHTATLGKTLSAIATQKAGIILSANAIFTHRQSAEIMKVLEQTCQQKQATLHEIELSNAPTFLPLFQQRNWRLAYSVYEYLVDRDNLPPLDSQKLAETARAHIPARMETFHLQAKTIILDGAHNSQKLEALTTSIKHAYSGQQIAFMVGFVRINENKVRDNLAVLLPFSSHLIITSFHDAAAEHHATEPSILAEQCQTLDYKTYEVVPDPKQALQVLLSRPETLLVVTGSFFLLQQIRPLIIEAHDSFHRRH